VAKKNSAGPPSDTSQTASGAPQTRRRSTNRRPAEIADLALPGDAPREASPATRDPSFEEIAEAAYHRFLKRGGADGRDFEDWVEAERELRARSR
jgi:hypothetical protein